MGIWEQKGWTCWMNTEYFSALFTPNLQFNRKIEYNFLSKCGFIDWLSGFKQTLKKLNLWFKHVFPLLYFVVVCVKNNSFWDFLWWVKPKGKSNCFYVGERNFCVHGFKTTTTTTKGRGAGGKYQFHMLWLHIICFVCAETILKMEHPCFLPK